MSNILNFIKEKSYYLLGATVLLIIVLIVVNACSGKKASTYEEIENKMVSAAKSYYETRKDLLPKEGSARVSISTLIEAELLSEVIDPKDSSNTCSGYVEVNNVENEYVYVPFLTCKDNYEPKYLSDIIKESKTDELGNGIYIINESYIYRGRDVNNYVLFNDLLWRVLNVDKEGNISLILAKRLDDTAAWDTRYNSEKDGSYGITTDYLYTDIRKTLNDYYKNTFTDENKAKMVRTNLCLGSYVLTDEFSKEKECSTIKENEVIGLINPSDYKYASLDENCKTLSDKACSNRNYLADGEIRTWSLSVLSENTYKALYIDSSVSSSFASNSKRINPVIYLSNKVIVNEGEGTLENPYIIK